MQYWEKYLATLSSVEAAPGFDYWHFGDSEEMANDLAELVLNGKKTATSSLPWEIQEHGWKEPKTGDKVVITFWNGRPACIIEITEALVRPFDEIDESFVRDYGEGDRSLAWWRSAMWDYYSTACRTARRRPYPKMPVACQRFRLVYR